MIDNNQIKLNDIAAISIGYPFRGVVKEAEGSGVFVIQLKDASIEKGIDWSGCIETELKGKRVPDWLMAGDILFSSRGRNNHAVMVEDIPEAMTAVASPHFFVIRPKQADLLPEYLAWLLNQPPCQRHIKRQAEGSFTQSIRRSVIEDTPVTTPSIQKQQSIINLAKTLKQQQQILKLFIHNGETTMNVIANDLFVPNKTVRPKNDQ